MKRFVAILLLFLTSAGIFVVPVIFKIKQARIHRAVRSQIRRGISREHLHAFQSQDPDIEWKEKGKEFSYQGEMYDVVFVEMNDGIETYYCLSDKEEQALNRTIGRVATKAGGDASGNITRGLFSIFMHSLVPPDAWRIFRSITSSEKCHPAVVISRYTQVVKPVNEPPPWLS